MESWFKRNLINLILVAGVVGLIVYFARDKSPAQVWGATKNILLLVLGLGFVIFFHELGHFLAAKACRVKVEAFSIGFGPAIPGFRFRWGETEYKLAWFPLGGYVKMPGEYPSEQQDEEVKYDPRSFMNKPVWQRMIIISAGVVMNVILGMICFAYVYRVGKTELAPQVSWVEPGSPADQAGIRAGAKILQVGDNHKPSFEDIVFSTTTVRSGVTPIWVQWQNPGEDPKGADIIPTKGPGDLKPKLGVGFPPGRKLRRTEEGKRPTYQGTPADAAGFQSGDVITGIRESGTEKFSPVEDGWELAVQEHELRGKKAEYRIDRGGSELTLAVEPRFAATLGFTPEFGRIIRVLEWNEDSPFPRTDLQIGDRIVGVKDHPEIDPVYLPAYLLIEARAGRDVTLVVEREKAPIAEIMLDRVPGFLKSMSESPPPNESSSKKETFEIILEAAKVPYREVYFGEIPSLAGGIWAPALGVAYRVEPKVAREPKDTQAAGKLKAGDEIVEVKFKREKNDESLKTARTAWPSIWAELQKIDPETTFELVIRRGGVILDEPVKLKLAADKSFPTPDRGLQLENATQLHYADNIGEAIGLGMRDSWRWIVRIYQNLVSLIAGDLSLRLLSGPIGIVQVTYMAADQGLTDLILFLGIISVNLAVVNFLPIPILDGGHMVFLLVEWIRGKPASERILVIANVVGLMILASLMLFVIFMDISRWAWVQRLFG